MRAVTQSVSRAITAMAGKPTPWNLWLDKLCFHRNEGPEAKTSTLIEVRNAYQRQEELLTAAMQRLQALRAVLANRYGNAYREPTLANSSRLLLHLGRSSVLENVGLYA